MDPTGILVLIVPLVVASVAGFLLGRFGMVVAALVLGAVMLAGAVWFWLDAQAQTEGWDAIASFIGVLFLGPPAIALALTAWLGSAVRRRRSESASNG